MDVWAGDQVVQCHPHRLPNPSSAARSTPGRGGIRVPDTLDSFGPDTLDEIDAQIRGYAEALGVDEGEVVNALYDAHHRDFDAALINAVYGCGVYGYRLALEAVQQSS